MNRTLNVKGLETIVLGNMDNEIADIIVNKYDIISKYIEKLEFRKACAEIIDLIEMGNKYYDERKPWIDYKENIDEFNNTIYTCTNIIANLSNMLEPLIPEKTERIRKYLKLDKAKWGIITIDKEIDVSNSMEILFERIK